MQVADQMGVIMTAERRLFYRGRRIGIALFVLTLLATAVILGVDEVEDTFRRLNAPHVTRWDGIKIGDSEARVRETLGTPYQEFIAQSAPEDYYLAGYGKKARAITGKVLIYRGGDLVNYVWIDKDGLVEDMFIGRS